MSSSAAVPRSTGSPTAPDADETRLHGHWLVTARIGWVVVTLTILVLNIIAFPDTYGAYFTFTPPVLQELHRLGLSPTLYSVLEALVNIALTQVVYLLLGLLLFWRRSNDRMALFGAFTLVTFGSAVTFYNFSSGDVVPALAANPILRVIALMLFGVGETSLVVFFYLFPSGQFAPRWTRWAALVVAVYYLAVVFFPTLPSNAGGPATYLVPLFLLTAGIAQVYRYRRVSTPRERQQTKWVVFGFALAVVILAVYIPISALIPPSIQNDPVLGNLVPFFPVALALIPIFIVIAITRSRLWDIDTLINKTLVYGSLTVLLGASYAGLIIGLESLAGLFTKQTSDPIVLVISTLAIFVLFEPMRQRIQSIIDRRFYRSKYHAVKTLAAFAATLRTETDLGALSEHLLRAVQETMQPTQASLWLRPPDQRAMEPPYQRELHESVPMNRARAEEAREPEEKVVGHGS